MGLGGGVGMGCWVCDRIVGPGVVVAVVIVVVNVVVVVVANFVILVRRIDQLNFAGGGCNVNLGGGWQASPSGGWGRG